MESAASTHIYEAVMKNFAFITSVMEGPFVSALVSSLLMIITAELGDKTFFIAALMSMKHSHITVFAGGMSALFVMTVLSAIVGFALPTLINKVYVHYISIALFTLFGIRMLLDALRMDNDHQNEELAEVEAELNKKNDVELHPIDEEIENMEGGNAHGVYVKASDIKENVGITSVWVKLCSYICHPVFVQVCTLTFVAEWGDRSQIATIVLAATKDPVGVTLGALLGHSLCTGIAVIGGKMLASSISERLITYAGGALFLAFAFAGLIVGS